MTAPAPETLEREKDKIYVTELEAPQMSVTLIFSLIAVGAIFALMFLAWFEQQAKAFLANPRSEDRKQFYDKLYGAIAKSSVDKSR